MIAFDRNQTFMGQWISNLQARFSLCYCMHGLPLTFLSQSAMDMRPG